MKHTVGKDTEQPVAMYLHQLSSTEFRRVTMTGVFFEELYRDLIEQKKKANAISELALQAKNYRLLEMVNSLEADLSRVESKYISVLQANATVHPEAP